MHICWSATKCGGPSAWFYKNMLHKKNISICSNLAGTTINHLTGSFAFLGFWMAFNWVRFDFPWNVLIEPKTKDQKLVHRRQHLIACRHRCAWSRVQHMHCIRILNRQIFKFIDAFVVFSSQSTHSGLQLWVRPRLPTQVPLQGSFLKWFTVVDSFSNPSVVEDAPSDTVKRN